jgi:hypothetical protein
MQASKGQEPHLVGEWTHSFEEDEPGVRVYRPAGSFPFPPARWRETLTFHEDGTCSVSQPGRDDRPREVPARWSALGMNRFRLLGEDATSSRVIEVIESTEEVLKIRDV